MTMRGLSVIIARTDSLALNVNRMGPVCGWETCLANVHNAAVHVRMASSYLFRWRSVATTVLRNNIATVMGPTPPGTGVIQPAT